jgi:hypothetical protein
MPRPKASKSTKSKAAKRVKAAAKPELYDGIVARGQTVIMAASKKARDIAPAPEVQDRARRDRAFSSLHYFLSHYFPRTFTLPWCHDHEVLIEKLQAAIERGGRIAVAMPRGQGKSSIIERSAIWAIATNRRKFIGIVAANEKLAERSLSKIKIELERNPLLAADFPKLTYPLHRLEGQSRRCAGQLYDGVRTCITYQRKELVLPTMPPPDNEGSGGIIVASGITSAVRGLSYVDDTGATIRPSMILCDDPQDRESSRSVVQTNERMSILTGDLLGMAGPGQSMTCIVPCTVINRGDMSDQLLNPERSPGWDSVRHKLVYSWPDRMDLWEQYLELFRKDRTAATEFYRVRFEEMNAGSHLAWPERHEPDELSALQNAFNLRSIMGEPGFMAEMQNDPVDTTKSLDVLDPAAIAARCGGFDRYTAPVACEKITAFIDVGQYVLWYMVCAWDEQFGCHVIDYSAFPSQRARFFLARNASPSLEQVYPGGVEAAVYAGLVALVDRLFKREWRRADGATLPLARVGIDEGWNSLVVRRFILGSQYREKLQLAHGKGITAAMSPMSLYPKKQGEKRGEHWLLRPAGKDGLRSVLVDTNAVKSRVADMLVRPMGSPGGVKLFGVRPIEHEFLASHLASETSTLVEANGRKVNQWDRRPDRENHLFDCLIGNAVAASMEGLSPLSSLGAGKPIEKPKRKSFTVLQMEAQARRRGLP